MKNKITLSYIVTLILGILTVVLALVVKIAFFWILSLGLLLLWITFVLTCWTSNLINNKDKKRKK